MALMYAAYFDASGKAERHPVISVGGAVAPVKRWIRFERDWTGVLKDEFVSWFHATDFAASLKEFKGWKGDKHRRASFLKRLGATIKANTNRLFMVTVEIDAWKSVNQQYKLEETFHSPYALAAFGVVGITKKWANRKGIKSPIEFIFEDGDEGWNGLKKLCARNGVVPIRLPKEKAIACQVGDLLAWKNRIAATNSLRLLGKIQDASFPDFGSFEQMLSEIQSLDSALISRRATCIWSPRIDSNVRGF